MFAVETTALSKTYPPRTGWRRLQKAGHTAVQDVSLQVEQGELFGLLGPNGAGKTTLVKMLCTLIMPTSGSGTVLGYDLSQEVAIRANVGLVVTDERSFYWRLTARHNLRFFAEMHGLHGAERDKRADEALAAVQLLDRAETRFSDFSTGMKQRMAIARGLLHRPKIIFLDEPSRSLDPTSTNNLHALIRNLLTEHEMTVFLITHDLSEAEKLCNRMAVMNQGRVMAVGNSAELRQRLQPKRQYRLEVEPLTSAAQSALIALEPTVKFSGDAVLFSAEENGGKLTEILDCLRAHNITIHNIEGQPPSLEEVFAKLTAETS